MRVRPAHRLLQDGVKLVEREVRGQEDPAPDQWAGIFERDLDAASSSRDPFGARSVRRNNALRTSDTPLAAHLVPEVRPLSARVSLCHGVATTAVRATSTCSPFRGRFCHRLTRGTAQAERAHPFSCQVVRLRRIKSVSKTAWSCPLTA